MVSRIPMDDKLTAADVSTAESAVNILEYLCSSITLSQGISDVFSDTTIDGFREVATDAQDTLRKFITKVYVTKVQPEKK